MEKEKITCRQHGRMEILSIAGVVTLYLPSLLSQNSTDTGILAYLLGGALTWGFLALRRHGQESRFFKESVFREAYGGILCVFGSLFLLAELGKITGIWLLESGQQWILLGLILFLGYYGVRQGEGALGKVYELLFWVLLLFLIGFLAVSVKDIRMSNWFQKCDGSATGLLTGTIETFLIFYTGGFYFTPVKKGYVEKETRYFAGAYLLGLCYLVTLYGIYQVEGLAGYEYPVFYLLSFVNKSYDSFFKQDVLLVAVWFFLLFLTFSKSLCFLRKEINKREKKRYYHVGLLILLYGISLYWNFGIQGKEAVSNKIEEKTYPDVFYVGVRDGQYEGVFFYPTPQSKSGEESSVTDMTLEACQGDSLNTLLKECRDSSNGEVDDHHIKVLLLNKDILLDQGKMEGLMVYLKNGDISYNTYVIVTTDTYEDLYTAKEGMSNTFSQYLNRLLSSRTGFKKNEKITVGTLLLERENRNGTLYLPIIQIEGQLPVIQKYMMYEDYKYIKTLDKHEFME